jgi:large subunit ribosomal protein L5
LEIGWSFTVTNYVPRLANQYKEIVKDLKKELEIDNVMQVPKLEKIVVNIGMGAAAQNSKLLDAAVLELEAITGQKAVRTKAKKSIAGFKLREGMPIGCSVTLRQNNMFEFLDRLINISIPRIRDFRGCSAKAFDGRGNYSLGIKEQIVFPEVDYDKVDKVRGVGITICTTAKTDTHAKALLEKFNFPFRK